MIKKCLSNNINYSEGVTALNAPKTNRQYVLLDNDELVCATWKLRAKKENISFRSFIKKDDFLDYIQSQEKNIHIYLDYDLGNGVKGEEIALQLYKDGFRNIYLTTGYDPKSFANLFYLNGVIGKTVPF